MKRRPATLMVVVLLALLLALPAPAQAGGDCGCAEPPPGGVEPEPPVHAWLPLVMAQEAPTAVLYPPPEMPVEPEATRQ